MKKPFVLRSISFLLMFLFITATSFVCAEDKLANILQEEVNREFEVLKTQKVPVYYLAYRVDEVYGYNATAQFGSLTYSSDFKSRFLTITMRVGGSQLDNHHPVRDTQGSNNYSRIRLPEGDNALAIKNAVWKGTNDAYQDAIAKYAKVKSNVSVKVDEEDKSADFTMAEPEVFEEAPIKPSSIKFDIKNWEKRIVNYSSEFLKDTAIFYGASSINYEITRKYLVSSSGDKIVQNSTSANVLIRGTIKAKDGMELPLHNTFFAYFPDRFPSDKAMQTSTETLVSNLIALKNAPVADPFSGPAILSASSAGVFFHEIFGHRVEGHRMKSEDDAQTFKKKVGELILPKTLSVYCDPLQKVYENIDLNGYYKYDDQGVKAQRVSIVENGKLNSFLMSRTPIKGFPASNGHGRAQSGLQPVSRQSNLVIETSDPKTNKELRDEFIRLVKAQKLEYGYLFQEVTGGFTTTGRYMPSSFNVTPTLVYRVFVDGRPDELVRGVDLIGTPLAMFSQIDIAGGDKNVFNGSCGAESGSVPVSCCSPMFLVKIIETQKKIKSQERPYILARPSEKN